MCTKIEDTSTHRCWADIMEKFIGKKNGQIKGLISHMWLILYYNLSYLMFVPNFKILGQAVPEKSLTKKKLTDRQTDRHTYRKSKNYIPPIYFVYRGYNKGTDKPYVADSLINSTTCHT